MRIPKIRIAVVPLVTGLLTSSTLVAQEISGLQATVVDTAATLTISVTIDEPALSKTVFVQVNQNDGSAVFAKAFPVVLVNDNYYLKDGDRHHSIQPGFNQFFFPFEDRLDKPRLTFFIQDNQGNYSNKLSATIDQK